jgi:predicted transcriptional regulator
MKIADLMTTKLYTVNPDYSVEGAVRLLQQRGVRHLLVLDGRIVTETDLLRYFASLPTVRAKK